VRKLCSFECSTLPVPTMKFPAYPPKYDWLLQLIVLPLYIGIMNWILIGPSYWHNWVTFGLATGIALIDSLINWVINNGVALKLNQVYPDLRQYTVRTAWSLFSILNMALCNTFYNEYAMY